MAVLGAGYSGLSTAIHLAEKGYKVVVVEGAGVGWGASGRNGGQVVNGLNASLDTIKRRYGEQRAFVGSLVQEGGKIIRGFVSQYGDRLRPEGRQHLRRLHGRAHERTRGQEGAVEKLRHGRPPAARQGRDPQARQPDAYVGGMLDTTGGHMHPLNLVLGEAKALETLGGVVYEQSPVTKVEHEAEKPSHSYRQGPTYVANIAVLCGNAYLGHVVPKLVSRVMPVSTQMIATEPLGDRAERLIPSDMCVEDVRYILDYFRLSADKRMIFGGGTVYGGTDPADVRAKIRPNLEKVFPSLKGVKIDYAWSGNFALSFSRVPQMGKIGKNTYFAHGYSGHGVTGSHLFGKILSEAIHGDVSRFAGSRSCPGSPSLAGACSARKYSTLGSWWYGPTSSEFVVAHEKSDKGAKSMKKLFASIAIAVAVCATAAAEENTVNVYNWSDYIAEDTVAKFEADSGIKVRYDVFDLNEILEAKLLTGSTGYDVVVPSIQFMARQAKAGVFQKSTRRRWPTTEISIRTFST